MMGNMTIDGKRPSSGGCSKGIIEHILSKKQKVVLPRFPSSLMDRVLRVRLSL